MYFEVFCRKVGCFSIKCCLIIMFYGKKKLFFDCFYNECIIIIVYKNIYFFRKIFFDMDFI